METGVTPAATGAAAGLTQAAAPLGSKTSFSDTTKLLQSNKNNWIVKERKRKNIVPVTGSGQSSTLAGVAKPQRHYWEIAVLRLSPDCSEDKIKVHLQSKGIEVKEAFVFPSKIKGTVSAKVRVAIEHKDRALDAATWPPHLRISSWTNQSKATRKSVTENRQDGAVL